MYYVKKIIPRYLKKADVIFSISESTKKDLIKYYQLDEKKIVINHNGFDSTVYCDKDKDKENNKEILPNNGKNTYFMLPDRASGKII